jgi:endonuclease/exonuclease/phosphatase family metal-dependent hydrolase
MRVQAEEHGLNLLYVPSMRNGEAAEDRGNAILTNLPLSEALAVELPMVRDRRVAVSAEVPVPGAEPFRVTSLHLDHLAELQHLGRSFGGSREEQTMALLKALPYHSAGILAGDFNAWWRQESEPALRLARSVYPAISDIPDGATVRALGGILGRRSDFILPRLPDGWAAQYRVLEDDYGSDHRPLVGTITRPDLP